MERSWRDRAVARCSARAACGGAEGARDRRATSAAQEARRLADDEPADALRSRRSSRSVDLRRRRRCASRRHGGERSSITMGPA
jgi:hypothetical protein